ncbi:MAG: hypothetical protein ACO1RA_00145 [Planctomycetaceae bacterium]
MTIIRIYAAFPFFKHGHPQENRGLGLATTQIKYEYPLTQKLVGITAGGWLRSATAKPHSGCTNMGSDLM